jgi:hypothetical protein
MGRKLKLFVAASFLAAGAGWLLFAASTARATRTNQTFSAAFQRRVLETAPEAPFELRFFTTAVKTDSRGRIITGPTSDPVKNILGAEAAGERGGLDRFERWYSERLAYRTRMIPLPLPGRRRLPLGMTPYGGSAFWCLAREALAYVHRFVREHPDVAEFFEHTKIPDELFFQTVLMNSPLAPTIVNDDLHYVDWSGGGAHPATLTAEDFDKLRSSGKLFARKFDPGADPAILDLLDRELLAA